MEKIIDLEKHRRAKDVKARHLEMLSLAGNVKPIVEELRYLERRYGVSFKLLITKDGKTGELKKG